MPDSDQTDSNASLTGKPDSQSSASASAHDSGVSNEPVTLRFLSWLGVSVVLAILVGVLFSAMPARFRLLGLLGIAQGAAVGAVVGQVARPFKLHYSKLAVFGGFVAGVASVAVTAILWWQGWAEQLEQSTQPRPDAAIAAQMQARLKESTVSDSEQRKAYEELRRQLSGFLDAEAAPPETGLAAWLAHRASLLKTGPTAAIAIGLLELLLAGAASSLLARAAAISPFCSQCQNWRRIVRSQAFAAPLPESLRAAVSNSELESVTAATVELSACECKQRPLVNLQLSSRNAGRKLPDVDLSEQQFSELKQLLDEAQGMN
ncbi:MAG: hypothetical protein ACKVHE_18370 [Planctomycetales bacterium]|jgi:hypothetical protein